MRFWRRGDPQAHSAFTTNISRTGLFLGSASALQSGERLRLEIVDPERGFYVEGRVARVHRVSLALRHVEQPGVGVCFLPPDELIDEFLPAGMRPAEPLRAETLGAAPRSAEAPAPVAPTPAAPAQAAPTPVAQTPASSAPPAPPAADPGRSDATRPMAGAAGEPRQRVVPVRFDDASAFLSVFHRDIQSGGLFVSSAEPAELNEVVWVELHLPLADARPELFQARVVQRFEPEAAVGTGANILAGMALQLLDPERAVSTLRPLLAKIRGS